MLQILKFTTKTFKENVYLAYDETNEAILIDCGCQTKDECTPIVEAIEQHKLVIKHLLCTHCHLDHVLGNAYFSQKYGIQPEAHPEEDHLVQMTHYQAMALGLNEDEIVECPPIYTLTDEYEVKFGNTTLKVMHTPGHSKGGICLYDETDKILFSGDTIMYHSIGASNLPGGRPKALARSVEKIMTTYPNDTIVYPGHGECTTIGEEKSFGQQSTFGSVRSEEQQ